MRAADEAVVMYPVVGIEVGGCQQVAGQEVAVGLAVVAEEEAGQEVEALVGSAAEAAVVVAPAGVGKSKSENYSYKLAVQLALD